MKLIDKDALVAEILKRIKAIPRGETDKRLKAVYGNEAFVLNDLLSFIDTLEVKEVDFSTEIYKYIDYHFNVYDDGNQTLQTKDKKSLIGRVDVENIAKHFFELGLRASNPLTWEDMLIIHRCIKDAMNYHLYAFQSVEGQQKVYEEVLKRFKAQKGE